MAPRQRDPFTAIFMLVIQSCKLVRNRGPTAADVSTFKRYHERLIALSSEVYDEGIERVSPWQRETLTALSSPWIDYDDFLDDIASGKLSI